MQLNYLASPVEKLTTCWFDQPERFKTAYTTSGGKKRILFISNNYKFIKEVFALISAYTRKIDPSFQISTSCHIKKFEGFSFIHKDSDNLEDDHDISLDRKFSHYVDISDILPRFVRLFYGFYDRRCSMYANCHGTALVASGVFPLITDVFSPLEYPWARKKLKQIPIKQIEMGDIVNLPTTDHSFVFLSHDISLTMNGRGVYFDISSTSNVLKKYFYPEKALKDRNSDIKVYRRTDQKNDFDGITDCLIDYFGFYSDLMLMGNPANHPRFKELPRVAKEVRDFLNAAQANPQVNQSSKDAIASLDYMIRDSMPLGALPEHNKKIATIQNKSNCVLAILVTLSCLLWAAHFYEINTNK